MNSNRNASVHRSRLPRASLPFLLVAILALTASAATAQTNLSFSSASPSVDCAGAVDVDVMVSDVTDLRGFSLYVQLDPSIVNVDNVVIGADFDAACPDDYFYSYGVVGGVLRVDASLLGCSLTTVAPQSLMRITLSPGATKAVSPLTFTGSTILRDSGNLPIGYTTTAGSLENICNTAPVVTPANFNVDENSANATVVGTVVASDVDAGDTWTFAITAGNAAGGFAIDTNTGQITVADVAVLDFETTPAFALTVEATDNDPNTPKTGSATINVNLNDVNEAPVQGSIGDKIVDEETLLAFTVTATDPDVPANTLTFSLDATALGNGMLIDANTGDFTWTPSEAQGPGLYPVTVTVSDGALTDFETINITVNDVNVAPVLDPIGNKAVAESTLLTFTATATDQDLPANTLTYSLDATALAAGMLIDTNTGVFTWTPTELQGPGVFPVTVTVSDGTLTHNEAIDVTVNEVNLAPVLGVIGNQTVDELVELVFTAAATDADIPANTLTYSLDAASVTAGMVIDANTGDFTWTPTEAQGPFVHPVTVTVTDNGVPLLADSETFNITVNEVNLAPVLDPIGDKSVDELVELAFAATATDPDSPPNTLTFSLDATALGNGMLIDTNTGAFTWTPGEAQGPGLFPVTVTVTDGVLTDFETINVTVNEANVAPVLGAIGDQAVDELVELAFTATATDADLPANSLTFSLDAGATGVGMAIDANTGAFTWTPSEAQGPGLFPVTVTVTDGFLIDSETINVTVNEANVAPVLSAIGDQAVDELVELAFIATATDADLPANSLTFSLDATALGNGMVIDANSGAFTWTPAENLGPGVYPATVTVSDGALTDAETINVTVSEVNVAPVLGVIGDQAVDELVELAFTATATDADLPANALTYSLDAASVTAGMVIDGNTGAFTWTPTEVQGPGVYPVTVTVTDNGIPLLADSETFNVTVNEVNLAPVLGAIGNQTVDELVELAFTATATDPDTPPNTLTFSLDATALANGMLIDANTGAFTWTPGEAVGPGAYPATVTVSDGALTDTETINITVNEVNVAPVLGAIGNQTVDELVELAFTATATDTDLPANTLTFSLDAGATGVGMAIDANTGAFTWTPAENLGPGAYPATVTVSDGALTDTETISITVNEVNVAPVLGAIGNQTVDELVELAFTATATDADLPANTLTFSLDATALSNGMAIDANTGAFTWTPGEAVGPGVYPATITVGDGALTDTETIDITVNEVNVAPVLGAIGNQTVDELVELAFTATATDADLPANTLTFSLDATALANGMLIDANTGAFTWTPGEAVGPGAYPATVTVSDGALTDAETISITVNEVNVAPILGAIGNQTVDELVELAFTATATDADLPANTLTFSLDATALGNGMLIDANTGAFTWTPGEAVGPGVYPATVTVSDGALTDTETIDITVNEVNVAPVLGAIGNQTVDELVELAFTATATDADLPANTLTFSLDATALGNGMVIDANTGAFTWTPGEAVGPGVYPATVTVSDGALTDTETIDITVNEVNVAPVLGAIGDQVVDELVELAFTATATDADLPANTLTFSLDATALGNGMLIDANTGAFTWTPGEAVGPGIYPATITVGDGALSDSETINITVNEVNVAPVLGAIGNQTVDELVELAFTATATDADLPANTLTFSLDAGATGVGMAIDANTGAFTWTPAENLGPGAYPATVTVSDGALTDTETISITVNEVNVAPVLGAIGNQTVDELVELAFTATATDADLPANTLTFSLDATALSNGMAIDTNTGAFTWTPGEAVGPGVYPATVTVSDGALTDTETIDITVNEVNVAPILGAIGNQTVDELVELAFTATATDADLPANTLTFSLDATALGNGMLIDANTGAFTWTPGEALGPGVYPATVTVSDGALTDTETIDITVNEVNVAPVLGAIGNQTVDELVELAFTATATDADLPANTLTFSLDATALANGMAIDANTGAFTWTPGEAVGPGIYPATVTVSDGALTDTETIDITVNEVNVAPVLGAVGDKTVTELVELAFTATATDADLPANTLTFSLDAGATGVGMAIDANTGAFTWTPTEVQGPGVYPATITVSDGALTHAESINITVDEGNVAPVLGAIGDKTVDELVELAFTATATDADLPANTLTFSLDATALGNGMAIDANTGAFTWTPGEAVGPGIYPATVTVGDGALSDSETINITVNEVNVAPVLGAIGNQTVDELVELAFTATATDADLPANTLTFSLDATALSNGMAIDANTGAFTWTPGEAVGPGVYPATVTVSDGALTDTETISITVNEVNVAPVLGAVGDKTVTELVELAFTATATDVDLPANTLTFSLDAGATGVGMAIDANTGAFTWTPTEVQGPGVYPATITVSDGALTHAESINITVDEGNVAPVLGAIGDKTVDELVELAFTATATDVDLPANTLTFSLDATALGNGMAIDANTGAFTWTPGEAVGPGVYPATVTVSDGALSDSETISITVNEVNVAPILGAIGNQTVDELVELAFTATATDADLPANTLTFSLDATALGNGMLIDANSGAFSWTPGEAVGPGVYPATVTVSDGALSDSETISITVNEVNVAPVLGAIGDKTVNELVELAFTATATDADLPANTLTFSLDAGATGVGMAIDANTGAFTWTPTEAQGPGVYPATVTVSDGALTHSETINITVDSVNVAPVLGAIGDKTVDELVELAFTATATDADLPANTLTFSLDATALGNGMVIDANTGAFTWTPGEAVGPGIYPATVTVGDGALSDSETINITVNEVNLAPVLGAIGDQTVDELVELAFTATATDPDLPANTLTFSLDATALGNGMLIDANTGAFTWTPGEAVGPGAYPATVTVSDGALTDTETISITVNEVNVAPILGAIGDQVVDELVELAFTATATDADLPANTLTFNLDATALGNGMVIDANTGAFTWTPGEAVGPGVYPATVTVSDGALTDSETINITVNEVNVAPILGAIGDQTVDEMVELAFTATATDADLPANTLSFSLDAAALTAGMLIDANTGAFTWTPGEAVGPGIYPATVTVSDGALSDSETISITVNEVNLAPVLGAIGDQTVNELVELAFTATATDSDIPANTLTFSLDGTSLAAGMLIDGNTGAFTWTPTEAQGPGVFPVTVTVSDGALSDFETIQITVDAVNVAPVLGAIGDKTVDEEILLTFTATATDADLPANTLTFSLDGTALAAGMAIDTNTGVFTWTPDETVGPGVYAATITVSDGALDDSETISITVNEVNLAPVLGAIGDQTVNEEVELTFTATATDPDVPANTLTFTLDATSLAAGMAIDANTGDFAWTPTEAQGPQVHLVTVTVSDGALTDTETINITVDEVNAPPVVAGIPDQEVLEGDPFLTINLDDYVTDPDHGPTEMTWLATGQVELIVSIVNRVATISAPGINWNGNETITFTATDPGLLFGADSADFTVTGVNDPPDVTNPGDQISTVLDTPSLQIVASDLDGDDLSYLATGLPNGLSIDGNGLISGTVACDAVSGLVEVTVTDDGIPNLATIINFNWTIDHIAVPAALADLAATQALTGNGSDGTTRISLTWTPPVDTGTEVAIYRKGFGAYPEYDDGGGSVPTMPLTSWSLVTTVPAGDGAFVDEPNSRDFWYYAAVVTNACGVASTPSNMTNGTLNYHLGDITNGITPGQGDNLVNTADISLLGSVYGTVPAPANNYIDFGPTTDLAVSSRPVTDNLLNFEELILMGVNYNNVGKASDSTDPSAYNTLTIFVPELYNGLETLTVSLYLTADGNLRGVSIPLTWNPDVVTPLGYEEGDLAANQDGLGIMLSPAPGAVDFVLFGDSDKGIAGEGVLATIEFQVLKYGDPNIGYGEIQARDLQNNSLELAPEVKEGTPELLVIPEVSLLYPNYPNPFNPITNLKFGVAVRGRASIVIYDIQGRKVRTLLDESLAPGTYTTIWDGFDDTGRQSASGVYLARFLAVDAQQVRRMTLIK